MARPANSNKIQILQSNSSTVTPDFTLEAGELAINRADNLLFYENSAGNGNTTAYLITADSVGNTQLEYNTGQHLTTGSNVEFNGLTLGASIDMTGDIELAGHIYVDDDRYLFLGTNNDYKIGYDEDGSDALEIISNVEGAAWTMIMRADQGDDNADHWKWNIADSGDMSWSSYSGGSWDAEMTLTNGGNLYLDDNLYLNSDASVINFGAGGDVTLTHVHDTGLLLNSTMALQFNDASQYINAPSATVLDINATDEIELNATTIDINGTMSVSGQITAESGLSVAGGFEANGNIDLGNSSSDTITSVARFDDNLEPSTDSARDLGTSSLYWANAYIDAITTTGNVTIGGDLTITGDDLTMGTNTSGMLLVADGTNFNPVAVSGDVTMASNGAVTIASGAVESAMLAGSIDDSKLSTITTTNKVHVASLDIDGATDIGEALADADLFIVDNGADSTERKSTMSRVKTYVLSDSTVTPASGDSFLTLDSDGSTTQRTTVDALATFMAGTNITASNGVLSASGGGSANDSTITLAAGDGLKTGGSFTTNASGNSTITFDFDASDVAGTGLTANGENLDVAAAQTTITSIYATDLIIGEDSDTAIDFGTNNEIDFKINGSTELTLDATNLYPTTDGGLSFGSSSYKINYVNANYLKAYTAVIPDAVAGANLGTTSAGWGYIYMADNQYISFGNDQDVDLGWDNSDMQLAIVETSNDSALKIGMYADGGEDDADKWQLRTSNGTTGVGFYNKSSGSYVKKFEVDTSGNTYLAGELQVGSIGYTDGDNAMTIADGGGVTFAQTAAVTGVLTADGGIDVDNFHLDGTSLELSSGDLTIDAAAGDLKLNAHEDLMFNIGNTTSGSMNLKRGHSTNTTIGGTEYTDFGNYLQIHTYGHPDGAGTEHGAAILLTEGSGGGHTGFQAGTFSGDLLYVLPEDTPAVGDRLEMTSAPTSGNDKNKYLLEWTPETVFTSPLTKTQGSAGAVRTITLSSTPGSALDEDSAADGDRFLLYDVSGSSWNYITLQNICDFVQDDFESSNASIDASTFFGNPDGSINQLTEDTDAIADKFLIYDDSASEWKYIRLDDLEDSIGGGGGGGGGSGTVNSGTATAFARYAATGTAVEDTISSTGSITMDLSGNLPELMLYREDSTVTGTNGIARLEMGNTDFSSNRSAPNFMLQCQSGGVSQAAGSEGGCSVLFRSIGAGETTLTTRFKIAADGSVQDDNGDAAFIKSMNLQPGGTGTMLINQTGVGAFTFDVAGSDERIKHERRPFDYGLKEIEMLKPEHFKYNKDSYKDFGLDEHDDKHFENDIQGLMAQDIEKIMPELVYEHEAGIKNYRRDGIVSALVNAVKELSARVAELEKEKQNNV
jgi:hypothetical protein